MRYAQGFPLGCVPLAEKFDILSEHLQIYDMEDRELDLNDTNEIQLELLVGPLKPYQDWANRRYRQWLGGILREARIVKEG